ncbi:M23 family metallopeptidase [Aneurinibacillus tyrosinisolvens]|uniref:M23 family metallopeptidase n=1 Tax=Aneurinibacillus tyrosinisolvens TaxID=1443435 RepID=UPI00069AFF6F|nr:M23 family metallopeptidase [Aneurinibacillus tyrosinisolvens]
MSLYDDQNSQDIGKQAADDMKRHGKRAGRLGLKALRSKLGKKFAKLVASLLKTIITKLVGILVSFLGVYGTIILIAALTFLAILSSIPGADWYLDDTSRSAEQVAMDKAYEDSYRDQADSSVEEIGPIRSDFDWKQDFTRIVKPSWAIGVSIARYKMVTNLDGKPEYPDAAALYAALKPKFSYTTISDDVERWKTVVVCCPPNGGKCTTTITYKTKPRPAHKVLTNVWTGYGDVPVKPLKKYWLGTENEDQIQNNEGSTNKESYRKISETSSENCTTTVWYQYENTEVNDLASPDLKEDPPRIANILIANGVKEADVPVIYQWTAAADPLDSSMKFFAGNFAGVNLNDSYTNYDNWDMGDIPQQDAVNGWVWPMPDSIGRLNSPFGMRWGKLHAGIDTGGKNYKGKSVVAARDGVVFYIYYSNSYGNMVMIQHDNGLQTRYAHLMDGSIMVHEGEKVTAGTVIAREGNSGKDAKGNPHAWHLHFEVVKAGKFDRTPAASSHPVNPLLYIGGAAR